MPIRLIRRFMRDKRGRQRLKNEFIDKVQQAALRRLLDNLPANPKEPVKKPALVITVLPLRLQQAHDRNRVLQRPRDKILLLRRDHLLEQSFQRFTVE